MSKKVLNYHDWSDRIRSMMKTNQENNVTNVTDGTGAVYAKNETK